MQVGGGVIVLLLAIAMVLGKESTFKGSPRIANEDGVREAAIVPLAVPLLAGPAAFSYVMGNSAWQTYADLIHVVVALKNRKMTRHPKRYSLRRKICACTLNLIPLSSRVSALTTDGA